MFKKLILPFLLLLFLFSCKAPVVDSGAKRTTRNSKEQQQKPYVILISLDGFRWDYVDRFKPPHLSKFIKEGTKAESLIPVFPSKTFPNHYSIATGMYPENHDLVNNSFYHEKKKKEYTMRDREIVEDGTWYGGTPIWVQAAKEKMVSASFFFVGSEADVQGYSPTYFYKFDNSIPKKKRINQVIDWLKMPPTTRPHLISLYFSDMDDTGHRFGPLADEYLSNSLKDLDSHLGDLFERVDKLDIPVNIVIVSDHGMGAVPVENLMYEEMIEDDNAYRTVNAGAIMHLYMNRGTDREEVYESLKQKEENFTVYKTEVSPYFQSNPTNPLLGDLIVVPDYPYYFKSSRSLGFAQRNGIPIIGEHGFDPEEKDLHGIFYANGPNIKEGFTVPSFENIHIYPLICKILGFEVPEEVDGKMEVLENVYKK